LQAAEGIRVSEDSKSHRRGGREQTTADILDAAEKLFSESGTSPPKPA
jgi:hypothetical protein